jgi:hypothetical protein
MALPSEDDQDAIDRAFEELVAGYHLTAAKPDPHRPDPHRPDPHRPDPQRPDPHRPDPHSPDSLGSQSRNTDSRNTDPLSTDSLSTDSLSTDSLSTEADEPTVSSHDPDVGEGAANWAADHPLFAFVQAPSETPTPAEQPTEERYIPEPLPPLQRPAIPALLGWIGIGYAIVIVLAATLGVRFPAWAGWIAVGCFVGGFGILMTRLPKERPPGAGDGAVL